MADGIIARIQGRSDVLTASEARLVAELMRAPREIALASAADFAARVGVHEATTSRLARKLGFPSYAAFRDTLRRDYLSRTEPADRMRTTLGDAAGDHLGHLIRAEVSALHALADHVDAAAVARAASALSGRRVFLFAHGHATTLAALAERRMRRMGMEARQLQGSARDLAEGVLAMGQGDALLIFAFRRKPDAYGALMRLAREVGAVVLVISDTLGPALNPAPDHLLSAPRAGVAGGFQTLNVPMLLLNALILSLGEGEGALGSLDRLGRLIDDFEGNAR